MNFPHDLPITLVQGPCKDCTERHQHCHGSCEKYAKFRAKCEALSEERQRKREVDECIGDAMKRIPGKRNI